MWNPEFGADLARELFVAVGKIAERQLVKRHQVTATWRGKKPKWVITKGALASFVFMTVGFSGWGPDAEIKGDASGERKWLWLDEGTEVRYATMTHDFQAKTSHRELVSGVGRGGLYFVNKRWPKPGIDAREFDPEILLQLRGPTFVSINAAIRRAF